MAAHTNFITPTSINSPPHSKGALRYRTKIFSGLDPDVLTSTIDAFLDSLAVDGQPWPHLVSIEHNVYPKADNPDKDLPLHFAMVVYLLTG